MQLGASSTHRDGWRRGVARCCARRRSSVAATPSFLTRFETRALGPSRAAALLSLQDGRTALGVAKDDYTRALLRNPPPRQAAAAPAASAVVVPADVAGFLAAHSLSAHGPALVDALGVECVDHLHLLTEDDLKEHVPSMKVVQRRLLLAAVAKRQRR